MGRRRGDDAVVSTLVDEDTFVDWLRDHGVPAGDDTAFLAAGEHRAGLVLTTDSQLESVHFPEDLDPWLIAQRLVRVNLSDLSAAGSRPRWALCNLNAPPDFDRERFFAGLLADCRRWGLSLIGGDTSSARQVSSTLTAIGDLPQGRRPLTRDRARPGDRLLVAGSLGEAAAGLLLQQAGARCHRGAVELPEGLPQGLAAAARRAVRRHRLPVPDVELGLELARPLSSGRTGRRGPAAIDLSDGLLKDAHRLAGASGVRLRIDLDRLPVAASLRRLAQYLEVTPLHHALSGGEDYVLLFSLPPVHPGATAGQEIGEVCVGSGLELVRGGRDVTTEVLDQLPRLGWDHLADG
ncbi:MAG: thiamine-phosphate kinase [Acidobacteria bacterium]|nr:MAG: thiamine-phosphate kinase [Acidobacteriota bacterium]